MSGYLLSESLIEKVYAKIPQQLWSIKVHKHVADELGPKEMVVLNSIGYLIYAGRLCNQIYGYVFDKDENIVAEENYFGYTEKEAREKPAEQKIIRVKSLVSTPFN